MKKVMAIAVVAISLATSTIAGASTHSRYAAWINATRPVITAWGAHNSKMVNDMKAGNIYATKVDLNNMAGDVLHLYQHCNSPDAQTNRDMQKFADDARLYVLYINNAVNGKNDGSAIKSYINIVVADMSLLTADIYRDNAKY